MSKTKKKEISLWYVRLIKGDTYHPFNVGAAVVEAINATEALKKYVKQVHPDTGAEGEFAGYEPTAEVIDMIYGVGVL